MCMFGALPVRACITSGRPSIHSAKLCAAFHAVACTHRVQTGSCLSGGGLAQWISQIKKLMPQLLCAAGAALKPCAATMLGHIAARSLKTALLSHSAFSINSSLVRRAVGTGATASWLLQYQVKEPDSKPTRIADEQVQEYKRS